MHLTAHRIPTLHRLHLQLLLQGSQSRLAALLLQRFVLFEDSSHQILTLHWLPRLLELLEVLVGGFLRELASADRTVLNRPVFT